MLEKLNIAKQALIEAESIDEYKVISSQAKMIEVAAREAKDYTMINAAKALQLRAQRYAGLKIIEGQQRGEIFTKGGTGGNRFRKVEVPDISKQRLSEVGITRDESSQYQRLASIEEAEFEQRLNKLHESGEEITASKIIDFTQTQEEISIREKGEIDFDVFKKIDNKEIYIYQICLGKAIEMKAGNKFIDWLKYHIKHLIKNYEANKN